GMAFEPMTLGLLEQCLWKDEVLADCGTLERFLEIGFGVCAVLNGLVVAEAYASVPGDRAYEIGAIVRPTFRQRALGYATCAALRRGKETLGGRRRESGAGARRARRLGQGGGRPSRFGGGGGGGAPPHRGHPVVE